VVHTILQAISKRRTKGNETKTLLLMFACFTNLMDDQKWPTWIFVITLALHHLRLIRWHFPDDCPCVKLVQELYRAQQDQRSVLFLTNKRIHVSMSLSDPAIQVLHSNSALSFCTNRKQFKTN
jgi:hypothetical protein